MRQALGGLSELDIYMIMNYESDVDAAVAKKK